MPIHQSDDFIGFSYLKTLQGICKITEILASLGGVLIVSIFFRGLTIEFYTATAIISILISVIVLMMYLTGVSRRVSLRLYRIQLIVHLLWAVVYIIAISLIYIYGSHLPTYALLVFGGIFGIIATIAHITDGIDNYRKDPLIRC